MLKLILLRGLVFILVFVGLIVGVIGLMIGSHNLGPMVDSNTYIKVWLDSNGDGKLSVDEPGLPGICVWGGYTYEFSNWQEICAMEYHRTDARGEWLDFRAGSSGEGIYTAVNLPEGYYPTTPLFVTRNSAEFGLKPGVAATAVPTPDVGAKLQQIAKNDSFNRWAGLALLLLFLAAVSAGITIKVVRRKKVKADEKSPDELTGIPS